MMFPSFIDHFCKKIALAVKLLSNQTEKKPVIDEDEEVDHAGIPYNLKCPITYDIMEDPVTIDGVSFDRYAIVEWMKQSNVNPLTNIQFVNNEIVSNLELQNKINQFLNKPSNNEELQNLKDKMKEKLRVSQANSQILKDECTERMRLRREHIIHQARKAQLKFCCDIVLRTTLEFVEFTCIFVGLRFMGFNNKKFEIYFVETKTLYFITSTYIMATCMQDSLSLILNEYMNIGPSKYFVIRWFEFFVRVQMFQRVRPYIRLFLGI